MITVRILPLTDAARDHILNDASISSLTGDGIVPVASQTFKDGNRLNVLPAMKTSGKVLHTDETGEDADLWEMLERLVTWWK